MRQRQSSASGVGRARARRLARVLGGLWLLHMLSGCILGSEKPNLALDVPDSYRAAKAGPESALPALDRRRGFRSRAALLPAVNFNGSATRSRRAGGGPSPVSSLYNVNFSASYVLDFWGKNRAALLAAEETAIASRFDRDVVALTTLASVANAYFLVLDS